ncbi:MULTISPECIES: hypothetical protein [unclassified Rhizobium]|uniref:hypothetical protein n=1 Tax=unclassified Rhizobium TaxID=2613769 RepID=UPI000714B56B|nr:MULTISPECIES: hypothetical protein [unclassified Rhizobium]KQS89822.1 hypothetical protein ASG42_31005 [Rhizobium sp. Leaf391]KQS93759.1 hypothetical protein ASG50_27790 [Rhizobium sp. Leaf386]KQT96081.1 hypothetical protein ASG68_30165 [Rhizobium sp. Leaf453]
MKYMKALFVQETIGELILDLQHAKGPDRALDLRIATAIGYERTTMIVDKGGSKQRKVVWLSPGTKSRAAVPPFTARFDLALRVAKTIDPNCAGAFTWGGTFCTAKINDGPRFSAATPMLAIIIAALSATLMDAGKPPH